MAVNVTCCGCSRQLRLPSEVIGSKVSCPICQVVFLTRSKGDDRAEAIPVVPAPAGTPSLDETDLLPLGPSSPDGVPDLTLDDPPPPPLDVRRVLDPEPDTAPLRMVDDDSRPAAPPEDRRRPRRDDEEEDTQKDPAPRRRRGKDEAANDRPRQRRRGGEALASFAVFFHRDPNARLSGRFDAEADAEGLKIWRGSGRVLEIPLGTECEYLGDGRLLVTIEGRKVELTTLHPDGLHDELAQEVSAFVAKRQDTVTLPVRRRGPVVWLALLPVGLPLLGTLVGGVLGFVIWTVVAAVLGSMSLIVVMRRGWSASGRAWVASLISLAGYLVLGIVARYSADGSGPATIPGPWCALAPVDGGFRAEVPGLPIKSPSGLLAAPWNLREAYCVNVNAANTAFVVAYGDSPAPGGADQQLATVARDFAQSNNGTVVAQRDLSLDGKKGVEFEIDSRDKGRLRGRAYANDRRLFAVVFGSRGMATTSPEAERFLDSFRFDSATGWPGPPTPGVANVARPQANPFQPNRPPVVNLGPGGKLLLQLDRPFVWCGVTPDGRLAVGLSEEGAVAFFDVADEREVGRVVVPAAGRAVAAALSPNGRALAVAGSAGTLHLVDVLNRGVAPHSLAPADTNGLAQWAVAFSPDGKKLATGHAGGQVRVYDFPGRKIERTLTPGGAVQVVSLAWPRADLLIAGDSTRAVRFLDPATGQVKAMLPAHDAAGGPAKRSIRALAVARDVRTLVTVSDDRGARGWDITTRRRKYAIGQNEPQLSAAFYPSGRLFATGSADGIVRVWNSSNGAPRGQFRHLFGAPPQARGPVNGLAFTPDGRALVVAAGSRLEVWKFEQFARLIPVDRKPLVPLPANLHRVEVGQAGYLAGVGPLAVSGDGRRVAFSGKDGRLRVWDALSFEEVYEAPQIGTPPVALAPSGGVVAYGSGPEVRLRDLGRKADVSMRQGGGWQNVSALALSADGKQLAAGHSSGFANQAADLLLWDVAARSARPLRGHYREVSGLAFAGGVLASVSVHDPLVHLWDAATGREFARMKGHADGVRCIAASPDGKRLATGGQDKTVRVWDAAAMREAFLLDGHVAPVSAVAFSPDGQTLASASADRTVKLWDVGSGSPLHSVSYESDVTGVGFGPEGKTLLVRAADGSLDRWDLEPIEALKKRPGPVTPDLEKSPAPEAPDLQPAGTIAAPTALVVSPAKKCALVFTRDRQVLRYSYPDWRLTRAALTRELVLDAALDPAKGLLYAATCEVRQLRMPGPLGWEGAGDVGVFDVAALLDGQEVPGLLKPAATVPVGVLLRDLCLVDGGRSLYFLACRKPGVWQPERIDNEARKPSGTIEMPHTRVSRLRASPDGKSLAFLAVGKNGPVAPFVAGIDPATAKLTREVALKIPANDMALGNGGVAVVTCQSNVCFVRLGEGKVEARPAAFADNSPCLSADGKRLYIGRRSGGSRVEAFDRNGDGPFDLTRPRDTIDGGGEPILGFPFWLTPDARFLVGATGRLLRLSAGGIVRPTEAPREPAPKSDGRLRELSPWREGHAGRVLAVAASPDGKRVLTGGEDRYLLFRAVDDGRPFQRVDVEPGSMRGGGVHAAAFSPDGRLSVVASWYGFLFGQQWPGGGRVLRKPWGRPAGLDTVAALPDNNQFAAPSDVGLAVWVTHPAGHVSDRNVPTKATLTGVTAHPVTGLIAAGSVEGKVYLFEQVPTGTKEKGTLSGHAAECRCVAFSPDGKRLVSAGVDGVVRAWDVEQSKPVADLGGPASPVMALVVAPDGKVVVAGGQDGSLRLWSLEDGKPIASTLVWPELPIHALAFAPNGKTLYTAAGAVVRRWDTSDLVGPPIALPKPSRRRRGGRQTARRWRRCRSASKVRRRSWATARWSSAPTAGG